MVTGFGFDSKVSSLSLWCDKNSIEMREPHRLVKLDRHGQSGSPA